MKKTIIAVIAVLVIVIAGALYYVFSNLDMLVKLAIQEYGSEAVQTPVRVEQVAISLSEGAAAITGLTVANPDGFSLPQAFSFGEVAVDIDLEKTARDLVALDAISITAPRVYYEINADRQGSLNVLKENIGVGGGTEADQPASEPSADSERAPFTLAIARFEFRDASLHAKVVPLNDKTYDLKLPALVLTNLQGTPEQIARQVMDKLIDHAEETIRKQGLDQELAEIKAKVQQQVDEERAKLEQKADERLEEEKQKVEDKLKDLLGR